MREADGVIELHLDNGHGCGKETVIAELLSFLSEKIDEIGARNQVWQL